MFTILKQSHWFGSRTIKECSKSKHLKLTSSICTNCFFFFNFQNVHTKVVNNKINTYKDFHAFTYHFIYIHFTYIHFNIKRCN